jgi:HNH endonuclease
MARPHDYSSLPAHPAVGTHYKKMRQYGHTTVVADVTCPKCGAVRTFPLYTLRQQMKRPNFGGECRACTIKAARTGHIRWHKERFKDGSRWISTTGYVMLGISSIPDEDLPIFKAMLYRGGALLEHRYVMAKALGRPLLQNESVDHMDGIKTNNDPANLRIYLKGKNQPGSLNGYGTYYHEWQMAEARNRLLMNEIERLRAEKP